MLKHPLILVPGLLARTYNSLAPVTGYTYWTNIPVNLRELGCTVHIPDLPPTASIRDQGEVLRDFLKNMVGTDQPVNLIAHSMGGLVARHAITHLNIPALSLVTISTPHRGSSLADVVLDSTIGHVLNSVLEYWEIDAAAFRELTTDSCRKFNETTPNEPGVWYSSCCGVIPGIYHNPIWGIPGYIIRDREGANDGLVSVTSGLWGDTPLPDTADGYSQRVMVGFTHSLELGWSDVVLEAKGITMDPMPYYREIVEGMAKRGF